jgi:hypothetical protein
MTADPSPSFGFISLQEPEFVPSRLRSCAADIRRRATYETGEAREEASLARPTRRRKQRGRLLAPSNQRTCVVRPNHELIGSVGTRIDHFHVPDTDRKTVPAVVNPNFITDVGTIIVSQYGAVSGRITGDSAEHITGMVVSVPGFDTFAKPDAYEHYLLTRVPPGTRRIVLQGI